MQENHEPWQQRATGNKGKKNSRTAVTKRLTDSEDMTGHTADWSRAQKGLRTIKTAGEQQA
ncbi:Hypothetical predicted protein, partial [Pelobates cultripes]